MLGTDGSYPAPGGACSGYLLRCGGFTTWLEAGPGSLANLQLHIGLDELDAVVVSHAHPDHWSDLEGLYVALRYFFGRQGVPVYAPQGLRELMCGEKPDGTFDWRVVGDGDSAVIGPARWTWSVTDHPVEALAARVQVGPRALGYSADTGAGWQFASLGAGINMALVRSVFDHRGRRGHAAPERPPGGGGGGRSGRRTAPRHPFDTREGPGRSPGGGRGRLRPARRCGRGGKDLGGMTPGPASRADGRSPDELRPVELERDFTEFAPGSVLVRMGRTAVLCTASFSEEPPRWLRGTGKGWVTAEYSMLPASSPDRVDAGGGPGPPIRAHPGGTAAHRP